MQKAKVFFTKAITPEAVVRIYAECGKKLTGKTALKVHTGEEGNPNYIKPDFWKNAVNMIGGTVVECNTAYSGSRNTTAKHLKLIDEHGWNEFPFDLMDAEGPDAELPVRGGKILKTNLVGKNLLKYDSLLVLSHFKGHPMGGYGGALKQLSIGCASSAGKSRIHSAGVTDDQNTVWDNVAPQDKFLEAMADAAKSVVDHFAGNAVYINVICNLSVDCDCCSDAELPCMKDIGICASPDPVALDKACLDLIYASDDEGKKHFIERVESRHGIHTIEAAEEIGVGTTEYELIQI